MNDPLAGMRDALNKGELEHLIWPDHGKGCPVKVGDAFVLRSCGIEITKIHRAQKGREWIWRAEFTRIQREGKPYFLDRRRGGYVHRPQDAMAAQDALGATIDGTSDPSKGEAPEPEAVPPHEIPEYTGSKQARIAHEHEIARQRIEQNAQPLPQQLAQIQQQAKAQHVDVSGDMRVIAQRIERLRNSVR